MNGWVDGENMRDNDPAGGEILVEETGPPKTDNPPSASIPEVRILNPNGSHLFTFTRTERSMGGAQLSVHTLTAGSRCM